MKLPKLLVRKISQSPVEKSLLKDTGQEEKDPNQTSYQSRKKKYLTPKRSWNRNNKISWVGIGSDTSVYFYNS